MLFVLRKLSCLLSLPPYKNRLLLLALPSLESHGFILGFSFLIKLLNGTTNSPMLIDDINYNVPNSLSRNFTFINISQYTYNYELLNLFKFLCNNLNDIYKLISIADSIKSIKSTLPNMHVLPMPYVD